MDINLLVKITSRAWCLDILRHLDRGVIGRQAQLMRASGASRTAFAQSLRHLVDLGLVERTPGHGHPLRPEFQLSEQGRQAAKLANTLASPDLKRSDHALLRRAWSIPILALCDRPRYFADLRAELAPITDRALSQSLKRLEGCHWVKRDVDVRARPLRPQYCAVAVGRHISQAAAKVLRDSGVNF